MLSATTNSCRRKLKSGLRIWQLVGHWGFQEEAFNAEVKIKSISLSELGSVDSSVLVDPI